MKLFKKVRSKFKAEEEVLTKRFGKKPSVNDVKWGLLNKDLIKHSQKMSMGLYRNTTFEMAEILKKEKKLKQALGYYLEVCYMDLNGPKNLAYTASSSFSEAFDPTIGFFAPGIVYRIKKILEKLNLGQSDFEEIFFDTTGKIYKSMKLPLAPEKCLEELWIKLK